VEWFAGKPMSVMIGQIASGGAEMTAVTEVDG
jgi:hypothetical protein